MNYITTLKTLKNVPELQEDEKLVIVAPADGDLTVADLNKVLSLRDAIGERFALSTYTVDAEMILAMSAPLFTNAIESFVLVDKDLPLVEMFKERLSYFELEEQYEGAQETQFEKIPEDKVEIISTETEVVEEKSSVEESSKKVDEVITEVKRGVEEAKPKRRSSKRKKAETLEGEETSKKRTSRRKPPSIEEKVAAISTEAVEEVKEEKPKTRRRSTKKAEGKEEAESKEMKVSSRRKKPESKTEGSENIEEKPKVKRRTSKKDEIVSSSKENKIVVLRKNARKQNVPDVAFVQKVSEEVPKQDAAEMRVDLGKKISELLKLNSKRYGFPMGDDVFPLFITQLIDESISDEDVRLKLIKYDKGDELWGIVKEHIETIRKLLGK